MEHDDLTRKVIGCAYQVFNTLGFGFLESVYHNSMRFELERQGIPAATEFPIEVRYGEHVVGKFEADLFIDRKVIVELKSVRALSIVHEVQLVNYLKATGTDVGLLINFGERKVEVKRKYRVLPNGDDEG